MRSEMYTTAIFIANCGGLLGLFLGISMLSIIEFIYFSTLRLYLSLRRWKSEHKVVPFERKYNNNIFIDMPNENHRSIDNSDVNKAIPMRTLLVHPKWRFLLCWFAKYLMQKLEKFCILTWKPFFCILNSKNYGFCIDKIFQKIEKNILCFSSEHQFTIFDLFKMTEV